MDLLHASVGIVGRESLVLLASWLPPAVCVVNTDAWMRGRAEFDVAKTCADHITEAAEGFVDCVHASRE